MTRMELLAVAVRRAHELVDDCAACSEAIWADLKTRFCRDGDRINELARQILEEAETEARE